MSFENANTLMCTVSQLGDTSPVNPSIEWRDMPDGVDTLPNGRRVYRSFSRVTPSSYGRLAKLISGLPSPRYSEFDYRLQPTQFSPGFILYVYH